MIPPKRPTVCNLCGGRVEYVPNRKVYGIKRGSGWCYRCTECGAYVGRTCRGRRRRSGFWPTTA